MAASSSAFSFHCMICFDEFNSTHNYPVVLPCGHTYVCINCANRLDKCMECRMPLDISIKIVEAPPPAAAAMRSTTTIAQQQQLQQLSPALQRRQQLVQNRYGYQAIMPQPPSPSPVVVKKQRLPLPKNAVLLSLIQASEPGRRRSSLLTTPSEDPPPPPSSSPYLPSSITDGGRGDDDDNNNNETTTTTSTTAATAAVEASPTKKKKSNQQQQQQQLHNKQEAPLLESPSPLLMKQSSFQSHRHHHHHHEQLRSRASSTGSLFLRPSLLPPPSPSTINHHHRSSSLTYHYHHHHQSSSSSFLLDEEQEEAHQIQAGVHFHNGVCGTYAVVVDDDDDDDDDGNTSEGGGGGEGSGGVVVYPTLSELEHAYDDGVVVVGGGCGGGGRGSGRRRRRGGGGGGIEERVGGRSSSIREEEEEDCWRRDLDELVKGSYHRRKLQLKKEQEEEEEEEEEEQQKEEEDRGEASMASTLIRAFHSFISDDDGGGGENNDAAAWEDQEEVEASIENNVDDCQGNKHQQQSTPCNVGLTLSTSASMEDGDEDQVEASMINNNNQRQLGEGDNNQARYNVGLTLSTSASTSVTDGNDARTHLDGSNISLNEKPSLSFALSSVDSSSNQQLLDNGTRKGGDWNKADHVIETERTRTLTETSSSSSSSGLTGRHISVQTQSMSQDYNKEEGDDASTDNDDSARPLIRLKYGDRVQVVCSDPRGWVKLARGYGYIRLQNDKQQLVKVGGASDRACQIESTLHELSIERDRLKYEQTKLERLSAGLMIDLQSTLLTSDDHVICSAPKGFLRVTDSDLCDSTCSRRKKSGSLDDIGVSITRGAKGNEDEVAVEMKTPSSCPRPTTAQVLTATSHSPTRMASLPSNQSQITPTREVNWRTGMSGHRALTSSHSHPHDFISASGGTVRSSMSNHAGVSKSKSSRPRASIY